MKNIELFIEAKELTKQRKHTEALKLLEELQEVNPQNY